MSTSFAKRATPFEDVTFVQGVPVTRPERTVFDLVADNEDPSLVADVPRDAAVYADRGFSLRKVEGLLASWYPLDEADLILSTLAAGAGLPHKGA